MPELVPITDSDSFMPLCPPFFLYLKSSLQHRIRRIHQSHNQQLPPKTCTMAVDEHRSPSTTTTTPARTTTTTTTASIHNSSSSPSSFKTRVGVKDQAFATPTSLTMPSTRIPNPDVNLLSVTAPKATTAKMTTITAKETTGTQRRPSDLIGGALWDLEQLKDGDALGLDAELVEDDVRLREPEHASRLLFTTTPDYYMHPNLEVKKTILTTLSKYAYTTTFSYTETRPYSLVRQLRYSPTLRKRR